MAPTFPDPTNSQTYQNKAERLTRQRACDYLFAEWGIERKPSTLAAYATRGGGPRYQKDGNRPLYTRPWLDEWAKAQLSPVVTSTAELKRVQRAAYRGSPGQERHHD